MPVREANVEQYEGRNIVLRQALLRLFSYPLMDVHGARKAMHICQARGHPRHRTPEWAKARLSLVVVVSSKLYGVSFASALYHKTNPADHPVYTLCLDVIVSSYLFGHLTLSLRFILSVNLRMRPCVGVVFRGSAVSTKGLPPTASPISIFEFPLARISLYSLAGICGKGPL